VLGVEEIQRRYRGFEILSQPEPHTHVDGPAEGGTAQVSCQRTRSGNGRGGPRTPAALRPDPAHLALLADPGFILKPDFDRASGALRRDCGLGQLGKVFLNLQRLRIALRVPESSGNGSLCVV